MKKKAVITGVFGQDGSFICEILKSKGYEVYGIVKKALSSNSLSIKSILEKRNLLPETYVIDLNNFNELKDTLLKIKPDEIYHTAAYHISSEGYLSDKAMSEKKLFDYNVKSTSNILHICYQWLPKTKVMIAGSCLMFDGSLTQAQDESTPFASNSLYGLAKITENSLAKYYRDRGLFISDAILYNHESERRADSFVMKKIIKNMVKLKKGDINTFSLGDLNAKKDWGYAKDYANAMVQMLQIDIPQDFILSTGTLHSVRDIVEICAYKLGIDKWEKHVQLTTEIDRHIDARLLGDSSLARNKLSFVNTLTFRGLVETILEYEMSGENVK